MKKVLLIAVAGMFVLTSCKKDWTCECTANMTPTILGAEYGAVPSSTKTQYALIEQTKSSAETNCDAANTNIKSVNSIQSAGGMYSVTSGCELK